MVLGGGCVLGWLQAGCRGAAVGGTRQGFGCRVVSVFCMFELTDGTLWQGKVGLMWRPPKGFLATFFFSLPPFIYFSFLPPGVGLGGTCFNITNLSQL